MARSGPRISVMMPMYNAAAYVEAALTSVLAQGTDLEVLVVDDGSTDDSRQRVQALGDPRIRLLANRGKGIAAGLNTALAAAQGELIARCDADDTYPPQRLARQADWLAGHPEFVACCGSFAPLSPQGQMAGPLDCGPTATDITAELRQGQARTHLGTFLIRTAALRQVGGFRPYFATAEDIDLQFRLGEVGRVWYSPQVAYGYRIHSQSITHRSGTARRQFFDQVARQFLHQRQRTGQDDLQRGCPPLPPTSTANPRSAAAHLQGFALGQAWAAHRAGQRWLALGLGWQAAWHRPQAWRAWRSLAALALKPGGQLAAEREAEPAATAKAK